MQLLAQEEEFPSQRMFLSELFQTQQYVDMVMSYQRMASMTKDLYAQKVDVDAAVQAAVRRVQPLFAGKQQVRLEVQSTGIQAVSDTKWLGLVLEQLLTNAVKYTRRGFVKVYAQDGALVVEDSGIGISPDELPCVFERGFTGLNGRGERHSSGLGLYLCRQITQKLGHVLRLESEKGQGAHAPCLRSRRRRLWWNDLSAAGRSGTRLCAAAAFLSVLRLAACLQSVSPPRADVSARYGTAARVRVS